ncbi:hypothetical protein [Marinifilum fragile]|uniref:hypothetical protein n=1 Tax=Marinifilum fragile TaxID=570161 RepID=UPI002AA8B76C|nr:hypothetical protein [Marinifilum fragile]
MKLTIYRIRDVLLILLYKFTFDVVYIYNVHPVFDYSGCTLDFDLGRYVQLTGFFILLLKPILKLYYSNKVSSLAVLLLIYLYFIPGLTFISLAKVHVGYIFYYISYWSLLLFWDKFVVNIKMPTLNKRQSGVMFNLFLVVSISFVVLISGLYTGFRLHFNILDVYGLRAEERGMDFPIIVKYLQPAIAAIIPCLIVYFLTQKKRLSVILFVILQLFLFGVGGHKSYLFALFIAIITYVFYKRKRLVYLPLGFVLINIISLIEGYINDGISMTTIFIHHRVLIVPNMLANYMFDFMESHELLYLRESILRLIGLESPYKPNYFFVIGEQYFGDKFIQANTGMCGDAYSQFGYLSLVFYPLLIPLVFSFLGSVCKGVDGKIVFIVVFLYVFNFINGSFFSVLLTNGFLMVSFVLFMLSNKIRILT